MMVNKHALFHRALHWGFFLVAALACVQVNAAWTHAQGSNGWTIDWDGGRMQQTAQWTPTTTANAAGGASWAVSGGNLVGSGTGRINNGPGYIDVQARVIPTKPTVAGAIAKAARRLGPLATGMAIVDLAKDLGYALSGSGDNIDFQKADPTVCTVAPCYLWNLYNGAGGVVFTGTFPQLQAKVASNVPAQILVYVNETTYSLRRASAPTLVDGSAVRTTTTYAPSPAAYLPSTEQAFIDSIALASGWPTSENFPKAVVQAIESGELIPGPVTATGPATSQGSKTTTTDSSGNVTQQQTVYNYTYADNRVSYTTSVVTSVNNVVQSTTVKENEKPTDECEGKQTAGCADLDTPEGEIPKTSKNVTFTPANLGFGGGVCPADKFITVHHMAQPVKVFNWQDTCSKLQTYARPMILTLATFVALMIVFSFRVES